MRSRPPVLSIFSLAAGSYMHRLFVNVETATSPMQRFNLLLLGCIVGVGGSGK